jgi:hypothetical protein
VSRPHDIDADLSCIVLGTVRSPGVVKLSGHDREKQWDIKAAKGQTGASSTLGGDPIGSFEAEFFLADDGDNGDGPGDFDKWEEFQRLIESTVSGPKPVALPIYHPDLSRNKFTEVVCGKIGGMVHDGRGGATVKVKFIEYKPPKPKPAAKAAPKPGAPGSTTRPDPNAAAKRELAGLLEEARRP